MSLIKVCLAVLLLAASSMSSPAQNRGFFGDLVRDVTNVAKQAVDTAINLATKVASNDAVKKASKLVVQAIDTVFGKDIQPIIDQVLSPEFNVDDILAREEVKALIQKLLTSKVGQVLNSAGILASQDVDAIIAQLTNSKLGNKLDAILDKAQEIAKTG